MTQVAPRAPERRGVRRESPLSLSFTRVAQIVLMVVLTAGITLVALRFLEPLGGRGPVAVVAIAVLLPVVLLAPVRYLPSFALVVYATGLAQFAPTGLPISAPVAVLAVWVIRRGLAAIRRSPTAERLDASATSFESSRTSTALIISGALLLFGWTLIITLASPYRATGLGWLLSFAPAVIVLLLVPSPRAEAKALKSTWSALGGVLGAYALAEFVAQSNFVYWALGAASSQHWSVYRSEGPFGHPLLFGTFLCVAAALSFGTWLNGGGRKYLLGASFATAGVFATSSRGAMLALFAALVFAIAIVIVRRGRSTSRRALGLTIVVGGAALVLVFATPILDRWVSAEATASTAARTQAIDFAVAISQSAGWLGTGAGSSTAAAVRAGSTLPIETSPLQALVSLGVPGSFLLLLLVLIALQRTLTRRDVAASIGLLAFVVAISGYNYLDDRRSAHVLFGIILVIALGSERRADEELDAAVGSGLPARGAPVQRRRSRP